MGRAEVVRHYGGVSADVRRAERRRKLLDAARLLWGEQGVGEVSVRKVCAHAGLTPRYFYEQFDNRDLLLLAVADEVRDELFEELVAASLAEPGDIGAKFNAALVAFLEMIAADPRIHRIVTSDADGVVGLAQQRIASIQTVAELVIEHAGGLLDPAPPEAELARLARFIVGGVNALVEPWLRDPVESPEELARICTRLCLAASAGIDIGA